MKDDDKDPAWVRASELFEQLSGEMLKATEFKFNLIEDPLAAKAAAILVTRMREMSGRNDYVHEAQQAEARPRIHEVREDAAVLPRRSRRLQRRRRG